MAEFLPLCDVLFNVISLAGYFCDIVFDMVFCYALMERGRTVYVGVVLLLVSTSLVISQIVSLRWYLHKNRMRSIAADSAAIGSLDKKKPAAHDVATIEADSSATTATTVDVAAADHNTTISTPPPPPPQRLGQYCVIALHCCQLGVLWRYAKLFVPVDLRHVKHEVRDLCMLRLVHAFCEAAPMLLLQLHVLVTMQPDDYLIAVPEVRMKTLLGGTNGGGGGGGVGPAVAGISSAGAAPGGSGLMVTTLSLLAASHHNHHHAAPTALQQRQLSLFRDLNVVSAVLSLFSVCWALASFSKNVRLQNVHRLVLTWLGVIFQFLWRLGTVVSRITALTVYASLYGYWIFLVLVLHWVSMFLWLISPKNVFHGERISRWRKATLAALIAGVYVFAYVNLQQVKHRQKMVTFYVVMFMENCLLVGLWLVGVWPLRPANWWAVPLLVLGAFAFGMGFMVLYYRYFHVRRLGYEAGGRFPGDITSKYAGDPQHGCAIMSGEQMHGIDGSKHPAHAIPGVFNCRFSNPVGNGATKRKKKKPTTFVPPPTLPAIPSASSAASQHSRGGDPPGSHHSHHSGSLADSCSQQGAVGGLMSIPFWRRPLPRSQTGGSSENEGSAGSRVNIQQKLQEKKQKQLAELKIIEEEIKQGKLGGGFSVAGGHSGMLGGIHAVSDELRQPIPRVKKHINVEPIVWRSASPMGDDDDDTSEEGGPGGGGGGVGGGAGGASINDLNGVLSSANLDEVNNLNKYTSNYDPLYNNFGLTGINIPAGLDAGNNVDGKSGGVAAAARNMSPISSQISATESNSLTRVVAAPRTKMLPARNPFAESYHRGVGGGFPSVYADGAANTHRAPASISPRGLADSPTSRLANHPRQISGTYSSSMENAGVESLPFPYSVVPPPRSKLDSSGAAASAAAVAAEAAATVQPTTVEAKSFNMQQQQQRLMALRQMQRAKTPEILLAPHYLDNSRIYYDWVTRGEQPPPASPSSAGMMMLMRPPSFGADGEHHHHHQLSHPQQHRLSSGDENLDDMDESVHRGGNHSDIDSQVSLPRSYTLPREFKYYRRNKPRKLIKNEHFITSTNSSDGDVDSGDDNESDTHTAVPSIANAPVGSPSAAGPGASIVHHPSPATAHHLNHHHRALVNQSQRRLRPPTAAVRSNFHHNHLPPINGHQSPVSAAMLHHSSAASSPLSHQAAAYAASGRLMPSPSAISMGAAASGVGHPGMASYLSGGVPASTVVAGKSINSLDLSSGGHNANSAINGGHHPMDYAGASMAAATGSGANVMNRQMRLRLYGNSKGMGGGGMPRHETKL